jgi:glycosyltransferase involved in cell wall biosynthesis
MVSNYISIIVPVYNDLATTKKFIDNLYKTASEPLQLIVVDNNSSDGTKEYLDAFNYDFDTINIIHNDVNVGFAKAVNQGLVITKYPYIYVMNNDIEFLASNWMTESVQLLKHEDIGIIGSEYLYTEGINFVTGAFMAFRKDLIDKIGNFDESFFFSWEDVDFCYRCQLEGYDVVRSNLPLKHEFDKPKSELVKGYHATARQQFIDKWKEFKELKKVVHINNQLTIGGIEEVIKQIVKHSGMYKHYVFSPIGGKMEEELIKVGASVKIRNFNRIKTTCKALMPNVVHNHTNGCFVPIGVDIAKSINPLPKMITTIHNPMSYMLQDKEISVGVSQTVSDVQYYPSKTINNGVELPVTIQDDELKELLGNFELGLDRQNIVVGRLGRLSSDKNVTDFILVANRCKSLPHVKFLIVGSSKDNYMQKCMKFARDLKLDNIIWAGEQYDKYKFLKMMDIFLYPTRGEGFGLSLIEAAQAGLPIISYAQGVNNEYKDFIYLVPDGDIDKLVAATIEFILKKDMREKWGVLALANGRKYDEKEMARKYEELYGNL